LGIIGDDDSIPDSVVNLELKQEHKHGNDAPGRSNLHKHHAILSDLDTESKVIADKRLVKFVEIETEKRFSKMRARKSPWCFLSTIWRTNSSFGPRLQCESLSPASKRSGISHLLDETLN
jgi:hypothetical protein